MLRRDLLATIPAALLLAGAGNAVLPGDASAQNAAPAANGPTPFDGNTVRSMARDLAGKPFAAPDSNLPRALTDLTYDQYRDIRFDPQRAFWRDGNLPFQMQLFHRGFLYRQRVEMFEVAEGKANRILYSPDLFSYQNLPRPDAADLGFAGFRLHAPINRPDYFDEVCAFLGASYFRAVGKDQIYGLSARGLAIKTAEPSGEEFPFFRSFFVEKPRPGVNSITVWALLDSVSAAASFRFTIRPGADTVFDVESTVFPRVDVAAAGIAPLTSMFWFAANDRIGVDDYRPAVHDNDGLLMLSGRGEQIWRPLHNPQDLQVSVFGDVNPRGFGLMQRKRAFTNYDDLEARYERRPSLWIEPIGDWGEGAVQLVEIPTNTEIHDNIVAFWRPKEPLRAKGEYGFVYRMHWLPQAPGIPEVAHITDTRAGAGPDNTRLFVVDAAGPVLDRLPADAQPQLEISASKGEIRNPVAQRNTETGGWRISFQLAPGGERLVELRALLKLNDRPLTESWIYRWTAG
ncbi:glucan biosynthesis protein [Roseomonas elaeocarpi]|uniref:Glucans biosynthesis protein G n=1 Tax=Roseomonas elaeocarpi TaxID=907779 RepID=A0ABV6JSM5_9PROT